MSTLEIKDLHVHDGPEVRLPFRERRLLRR